MADKGTDIFRYVDNFAKIAHVESIPVKKAVLESPLITIAIPTYKRADLLKEAIDSALKQDYDGTYEGLVVDNNPERGDETELLLRSYAAYAHVSYYKNAENVGMFGNWNRLYELAQGTWVVMLHDDDMLCADYLRKMTAVLEDGCGLIACKYSKLQDGVLGRPKHTSSSVSPVALIDFAWGNCIGAPVGVLMHRGKVLEQGGFNDVYYPAADYYCFAQMAKAYPAYMVNEQLSIYRMECNASFRTEVLDGFMRANYAISNAIWRMCEIPPMVRKSIEVCRIKKQVKSLRRNWRRDYCCSEIPVTRNPFVYWFSYFVYKTLYLNLIRYRKYRQRRYYVVPEISEREGGR